MKYVEVRILSL